MAPPTTRLLVDHVVYAHPLRTLSIFRALFLSATSSFTLLFPTFPLHAGFSLHSFLPLSWPFLFFSACFAFASLTVTVLHHLTVPVIHVVAQSTLCFSGLNLFASPLGHRPSKCSFFNTSLFPPGCLGCSFAVCFLNAQCQCHPSHLRVKRLKGVTSSYMYIQYSFQSVQGRVTH